MKALRGFLFALGALVGGYVFYLYAPNLLMQIYSNAGMVGPEQAAYAWPTKLAMAALGCAAGAASIGNGLFGLINRWLSGWDKMHAGDKVNIFVGIFFGVIVTVPFIILFSQQGAVIAALMSFAMMLFVASIAIYALHSIDDLLPWSKNRGRGRRSGIKVLDTNIIIDGRILEIVRCGFLDGQLYVPRFVLEELQYIADNADSLKRQRGKRGLDLLQQLQAKFPLEVGTHDRLAPEAEDGVDGRLVRLARAIGGDLVTNDHNLNRVAALQEVRVINVNELALALRPTVLPGEPMEILVFKEGSQPGQGIGYLDDGTMIVVEGGRRHVGENIMVTVTQVHQTERGKMIFAETNDYELDSDSSYRPRRTKR